MEIGDFLFRSSDESNEFFSLSKKEMNEFEEDLNISYKKAVKKLNNSDADYIICDANQRLGDKHFIVKILFGKVKNSNEWIFCLHKFKKVSIDEYLDSINDSKRQINV